MNKKFAKIILVLSIVVPAMFAGTFEDAKSAFDSGEYEKAASLCQKACDDKDSRGCVNLGVMQNEGVGVKQNKDAAISYFQMACGMGDKVGCADAAMMAIEAKDLKTASLFFSKACTFGDQEACTAVVNIEKMGGN